jgi:UDP-glucose 4-epimerase
MILVIGASGFIGTYLIDELLRKKYTICGTGRNVDAQKYYESKGIQFIKLDITNIKDFNKLPNSNIESVILLAALLPANDRELNPQRYIDVNIKGTLNVLEFCRKNDIEKLISTTSYADVMKRWRVSPPITEDEPRDFILNDDHTMYIISKNASSDLIYHYNELYGLQGSVFRLPPVIGYGPHSEIYINGKYYKSGFQIFLEKALSGEEIEIYGNSQVIRDIVSVKDVAKAFRLAIESNKSKGLYNISSGIPLTLEEQVKATIIVFSPKNKPSQIRYSPNKPNNSKSYLFNISKAKHDFGYKPQYIPYEKLLEDYKLEMAKNRFPFLINPRKKGVN